MVFCAAPQLSGLNEAQRRLLGRRSVTTNAEDECLR